MHHLRCILFVCFLIVVSYAELNQKNEAKLKSHFPVVKPFILLTQLEEKYIVDTYHVSNQAKQIRSNIPRLVGPSKLEFSSEYRNGLIAMAIPPIAIGALFGLIGLILFITKQCCKKCTDKAVKNYTTKEKWCPFAFLISFALISLGVAIAGIIFNEQLSGKVSNGSTLSSASSVTGYQPEKSSSLLETFSTMFDIGLNLISTMNTTLFQLSSTTDTVFIQATNMVDGATRDLKDGTNNIIQQLSDETNKVRNNYTSINVPAQPEDKPPLKDLTFACTFCKSAADDVGNITKQIKDNADGAFRDMNDTVTTVKAKFFDIKKLIKDKTGEVAQQLNDASHQVESSRDDVSFYSSKVKGYDVYRRIGTLILLLLPLISGLLAIVGGATKKEVPFSMISFLGFLILFFFWILFGIYLSVSVATGDSCDYLDKSEVSLHSVMSNNDAATFAESCLLNSSLVDAFNLTSQLNYAQSVKIYPLPPVDQVVNFSLFNDYNLQVQRLNATTFGFQDSFIPDAIDRMNSFILKTGEIGPTQRYSLYPYNRTNVASVPTWNSSYYNISIARNQTLMFIEAERQINAILKSFQQDMTNIAGNIQSFQILTRNLYNNYSNITTAIQPVLNYGKTVYDLAFCGSLGESYKQFKRDYCDTIVVSASVLALVSFIVGVLGLPIVILSSISGKRLPSGDIPSNRSAYQIELDTEEPKKKSRKSKSKS